MSERLGVQHDEHVFERNKPTLERITELAQKGDPLYQRFRSWVSKRAPQTLPQRGESKEQQGRKNIRLLHDYIRYLTRIYLPRQSNHNPDRIRHHNRLGAFEEATSQHLIMNDLPAEYERFQRAVHEARGQEYDSAADLHRIRHDQHDVMSEWANRLIQYDHYTAAFQYLMWRSIIELSSVRNGTEEAPRFQMRDANTVMPIPPFHETAVGFLYELLVTYDRTRGNVGAINKILGDSFFAEVANDATWKDRLIKNLASNSINELYVSLSALVTEYEEMEGAVEGRWIEVTKQGVKDELTKAEAKAWGQSSLTKRGDGAQMLKELSSATPWCLRFKATADSYLADGKKLLVFLENTPKGVRPAFGVAFDKNGVVYEARGANDRQELSPRYADVVDMRMKKEKPPGWEKYAQRLKDTQTLAAAERFLNNPKLKPFDELKLEEQDRYRTYLRAIYELDRKLVGFGYGQNTYAKKMRDKREQVKMKDAEIIFGKIAHTPNEINSDTKAYVGPLSADLWDKLGNIKHIYTSFPDEPVLLKDITLGSGPKTGKAFADTIAKTKDVDDKTMVVGTYSKSMLEGKEFKISKETVPANLAVLSVAQLGFPNGATYQEIKDAATQKFGLKLCPPEVGPQLRLAYADQPDGEYLVIGMEPISVSGGYRRLFYVPCYDGKRWLDTATAIPATSGVRTLALYSSASSALNLGICTGP